VWMADDAGAVREELVWSVLDCPGGLATVIVPDLGVTMLGRLTAQLARPLETGREYVAIGWPIERNGRKFQAGSAIFDEGGDVLASAAATWIELKNQPA
jgi:predicted amidohydrolase